jgi:hypothetical protein
MKKYGGVEIIRENTFKFSNTEESLQELIMSLVPG